MTPLNITFRDRNFKIRHQEFKSYIWDIIRKKYVVNTPEEWVRQHIVHSLIYDYSYPPALISIEKWITLDNVRKRFDILIYDRAHQPFMIIECKSPKVQLTSQTLHQLLNYQRNCAAQYLMITNGTYTFLARTHHDTFTMIDTLPSL